MTRLGADPDALRELGSTLRRSAAELERISGGLERRLRSSGWRGPDAQRFEREWTGVHRVRLAAGARRCSGLAATLEREAAEQERTSSATGPAGPPAAGPPPAGPTATGAGRPASTGTDSAAVPDRSPPLLAAPPSHERRFLGGLDLTLAFGTVSITGDLAIQQLDDGRVRVVHGESGAVGLAAGAGGRVDVAIGDETPDPVAAAGSSAAVAGRLGSVERRSWTVHPDEVEGLVRRLGTESVVEATPLAPAVGGIAGLVDRATEWLTGLDPGLDELAEPPPPEATEQLAELSVLAAAGAGLGPGGGAGSVAGLAGSGAGSVRVGVRSEGRGAEATLSAVVEADGRASVALGGALAGRFGAAFGDSIDSVSTVRLELPVSGPRGGSHAFVTTTGGDGSTVRETRAVVDLTHPAATREAQRVADAARAVRDGHPDRALELLRSVRWPEEAITAEVSTAEVSGSSGHVGGRVALGAGLGASARGQVLELRR